MFKLKFDTSAFNAEDLIDGLKTAVKSATQAMIPLVEAEGRRLAKQRLFSGRAQGHWDKGFKVAAFDDNTIIVSIEGKLADWMESGIKVGEISDALMKGARAEHNTQQAQKGKAFGESSGKKYVDVPMPKDANAAGMIYTGPKGQKVNVQAFKNAAELSKAMTFSDYKSGQIKQKRILQSRVKDVIKMVEPKSKESSFLMIRRVTEDSVWPKTPFKGANIIPDLNRFVEDNIGDILGRYL